MIAHIKMMKKEIRRDMADGVVPTSVRSFEELHDYVDANEYLPISREDYDDDEAFCFAANGLIEAVHVWLSKGAL
jgi:hypothetical protein